MWDWVAALHERRLEARVLATVVRVDGSAPREVGARLLIDAEGVRHGTLGGGKLEALVEQHGRELLGTRQVVHRRYPLGAKAGQCCGGAVEVMMEAMLPRPVLYLFGAGHVGQAVARVMEPTRFDVVVVDDRSEWVERLPAGTASFDDGWDLFVDGAPWGDHVYVAIMTHSHALDADVLAAVLAKPTAYVGLIGSRTKWQRFRERMLAAGVDEARVDEVECPLGIPLPGKEPGDVAVSLAARLIGMAAAE